MTDTYRFFLMDGVKESIQLGKLRADGFDNLNFICFHYL